MPAQSVTALSQALHERKISAVELTTDAIKRIHSEHALNAFISVNDDQALIEAQHADRQLQKGLGTRLTGIPMAHKDIFCTKTLPTTCGSKMLANFTAPYQATLVEKLASNGVVMMGKTNMDEFAMGSTNESSYFGAVKNPWDKTRVPGGSSGGSAAAVAASLCAFSTGSDTGGSVRQPAALCGISGLKPTYGLISRYGMVAYASSLDTAGILARSAEDIALILEASVGFDELDSTSLNQPAVNYLSETKKPIQAFRVGLPRCFLSDKIEPDIQTAVLNTVRLLEQLGAQIVEMDLPLQPYWIPCYYVLACAEASSNLSRYDGIRYGHRSSIDTSIEALVTHSREEGFGAEVKRRILTGIHVLSAGYYEDYYVRAQKVRRLIRNELCSALSSVDFILGPTTPTCAFKLNTPITDPTEAYLADVFTVGANLAGVPALSIPGGFNHAGLPIGIQFIGAHFSEARLLQVAHAIQQHTLWHQMTPTAQGVKS